jgi:hypothetical protein
MVIAMAHRPDASALWLVEGPDFSITRDNTPSHRPMANGPHSEGRSALPARRAEWPTISGGARRVASASIEVMIA